MHPLLHLSHHLFALNFAMKSINPVDEHPKPNLGPEAFSMCFTMKFETMTISKISFDDFVVHYLM